MLCAAVSALAASTASAAHHHGPTANLSLSNAASPPLTVIADASGSQAGSSSLVSFRFDFGDGSPRITTKEPARTATHTYGAPGTYTVKLTVTDKNGNTDNDSHSTTFSGPPPEAPPVAHLTVRPTTPDGFEVMADGSATTDPDSTPVASYQFDFGDGSAPLVISAPTASATYTFADSGTYTVTLIATDTGGSPSAPATTRVTVPRPPGPQVVVSVGYYDTHHPGFKQPKPDPWQGSPNVIFAGKPDGSSGGWDASAVSVENHGAETLASVLVTVDIGAYHFALWGTHSIPAGSRLIVTQTGVGNFDGSDTNPAGCYGCDPDMCSQRISSTVPVVHVRINGTTTNYYDIGQVLNTHGVDAAGCPATGTRNDESHAWVEISSQVPAAFRQPGGDADAPPALVPERPGQWLDPPQPNPSAGDQAVRFGVGRDGPVRLAVYDVAGRLERTVLDQVLVAGSYDARLNLVRMPRGLHYYRLLTPQGTQTRAFVLLR